MEVLYSFMLFRSVETVGEYKGVLETGRETTGLRDLREG